MTGRRLAFSTLGQPGIAAQDVIDLARAHSACGVELRVADGEVLSVSSTLHATAEVGSALRDGGMTLIALNSYVSLCAPGESADDATLVDLLAHVELARAAGASGVRVFMHDDASPPGPPPVDGDAARRELTAGERRAIRRLSAARTALERTGVRVLIETHDSHPTGASLAAFLEAQPLDPSTLQIIWDTAHSWAAGESLAASFDLLGERLAHIQVKDIISATDPRPTEIGTGSFPIDELAEVLATRGWQGWVSLEWERAWHPELSPLDEALTDARRWAARALDPIGTP